MEAAFFDLDKTVIAKASMLAFGRKFFKEGMISRRSLLRSAYAQLVYRYLGANEKRLLKLRKSVLSLTAGWDQSLVRKIISEGLIEIVEPLLYKEAIDLIEEHRSAGRLVYLVSAAPYEIVAPLAEHLGVDGALASRPTINEQGLYTGEMDFYNYGPYKVSAMEELAQENGIDLNESYAYSDSYTDIPMLETVGHPYAVNPDKVLAKISKERDWPTLEFKDRVLLSDPSRRARPFLVALAATTGVAIAATAGGIAAKKRHSV